MLYCRSAQTGLLTSPIMIRFIFIVYIGIYSYFFWAYPPMFCVVGIGGIAHDRWESSFVGFVASFIGGVESDAGERCQREPWPPEGMLVCHHQLWGWTYAV